MADTAATQSAALALADERSLMRQGYRFLDEKRMLLAGEMLRGLARHEALHAQLVQQLQTAQSALRDALQRHGLEGLLVHPPAILDPPAPQIARRLYLGVPLTDAAFTPRLGADAAPAVDASPEARRCAQAFVALLEPLAALAASSSSLERLAAEYRRTERRARALENVLLPEVEATLAKVEEQLEHAEQEDAIRVRTRPPATIGGTREPP